MKSIGCSWIPEVARTHDLHEPAPSLDASADINPAGKNPLIDRVATVQEKTRRAPPSQLQLIHDRTPGQCGQIMKMRNMRVTPRGNFPPAPSANRPTPERNGSGVTNAGLADEAPAGGDPGEAPAKW